MEVADPAIAAGAGAPAGPSREAAAAAVDQVRLRRRTIIGVLEQCQRALEELKELKDAELNPNAAPEVKEEEKEEEEEGRGLERSDSSSTDYETDELCDLLKSKVESPDFLEKLGSIHMSVSQINSDECTSWDLVSAKDLWEEKHIAGDNESDQDDYVLVKQEDIVEGIACFMAAYLLSLKETKELTPNQLQDALSKTFSLKKKKSKLRKAWDGSKVIYNVASWGATAIGIYQNPALFRAASVAFWTSCRVISKLL